MTTGKEKKIIKLRKLLNDFLQDIDNEAVLPTELANKIAEAHLPKFTVVLEDEKDLLIKEIVKEYGNFVHPYIKGHCLAFYLLSHTDYEKYIHNQNYYTPDRKDTK